MNFKIKISIDKILIYNVISIIFFALICFSCNKVPNQENIYGLWEGELHNKKLIFEFKTNQKCILRFNDNALDSFQILNGNFKLDFSKKTISLSIRNIPQLDHPLHTIVEFIGNDSIKLANFAPRWKIRPIAFNRNTTMSLKRVKKNKIQIETK